MKIYTLKSCDTCRKSIKELRESGFEPQIIDVRNDGVSVSELTSFFSQFGEKLINRRSTTWRNLSNVQRTSGAIDLLASNPTLMKRPIIRLQNELFLGWDDSVRNAVLLAEKNNIKPK
ncbi:MAG: ArsC/Spx/MgsR family protein [Paracoccaceae bacterium]